MSLANLYVVLMCGICAIITGYSVLMMKRDFKLRFVGIACLSGMLSMVLYTYHFEAQEPFLILCLYYGCWLFSAFYFAKKMKA
ncbi:hypothetical protein [Candidatus Enterococcus ferrettii]|uniref:Uncharacterized protein n=1 Tax=Candidatus Enterococcus ferrettii TaxID=2815324 RepID=A0ABV0EVB2_9ENTE|nr:hypothetical protein [Enterococcus sp. 665A]MBO1338710.1 hypothetical protein [Enterococcus sp. 665A]